MNNERKQAGVFRPKVSNKTQHHGKHNPWKSRGSSDLSAIKEKPEEEEDRSVRKINLKTEAQNDVNLNPFKEANAKSKRKSEPISIPEKVEDMASFK